LEIKCIVQYIWYELRKSCLAMKSVSDLRSNFCRQVKYSIELDSMIKNEGFLWDTNKEKCINMVIAKF